MTENKKYYTPSLEEFHVGFEFEYFSKAHKGMDGNEVDSQWNKCSDWIKEWDWFNNCANGKLVALLNRNEIRVKYLDQDDIIELGWEQNESHVDEVCFTFGYFLLTYFTVDGEVMIQDNDGYTRFCAIIKNKSELRKVMQMVGINN
jgi:hypothetical protein